MKDLGIFTDAIWNCKEHGDMILTCKLDNSVYGDGKNYNFYWDSKEEAYEELIKWEYRLVA